MDYDERVLPSIGNEVLKSIVAQFDAAELITQREIVLHRRSITVNFRFHQEFVRI
jgi:prohibitin 1